MWDHLWRTVDHWQKGPCVNPRGYVYFVARVDEVWLLRLHTVDGHDYSRYYSDCRQLILDLKDMDR